MKEALYARVGAFLTEFPFLNRYVKIHRFSKRPTVQRVDLDLLDRWGWTDAYSRQNGFVGMGSLRFLLIDANGHELGEAKPYDMVRSKFCPWRVYDAGETILKAIQRVGADPVRYVLEVKDLLASRTEDYDPDIGLEVVLHKVPAGRSFSEWLSEIRDTAVHELRGELTKVDNA